jgi:YbgC/YbaW family acyl-CoA thioester hydrolase
MKISSKSFVTVRGYELDSYGHVNNAVYLQYYEYARWEMMKDLGFLDKLKDTGLSVVVVESLVRYMRETNMFDELLIESSFNTESPYLIFYQKIIDLKTNLPVSRARIKTIFLGTDKLPQDIPQFLSTSQ